MKPRFRNSIILLLSAGVVVALCVFYFEPDVIFYFAAGWLIVISFLLWIGNRFLSAKLDVVLPWSRYGNWRFFAHLFLGLLYLLVLINGIYFGIRIGLTDRPPTIEQVIVMNTWGSAIFIPVFSLYFSLYFLRFWRQSEVQVEKAKKDQLRAQLDSLKNHLDPHFLFNNLNILASLIDSDANASKRFIEKFAEVYRTLLRAKSEDLIPVYEELEFIDAYLYLIRMRFENNIQFQGNVSSGSKSKLIPPLTLQLLIENAFKHNLITEGRPLQLELFDRNGFLVVRNSLFKKPEVEKSSGSGLMNIKERFAHFTDKPVSIIQTETHFEVSVPLLQIEPS